MIELKYRLTGKTSGSRKLDTERASNYSLASFLWYLNNRVYILLDGRSQNSLEDTDDGYLIREQKIKEIKSIFMNRITHIISNALKTRERKGYPEVAIDDVKKIFEENLMYLLQLFFGYIGNFEENKNFGAYDKQKQYVNGLGIYDFKEDFRTLTMDCKKALFTSFLEATIGDIIVPKNGGKDRIGEILNIIKNPLSKIDIVKYTKLIRYCTLNIKIDGYEVEDLIQEGLEKILRALKHYQGKGFAMPETYVRTIIINHFRDLRRMQFALKRGGEIITRNMGFYDGAILDEFSYRLWELIRNYDGGKLYSSDGKIIDPDLVLDTDFLLFPYNCPIAAYGYFKNNNEKPKK